MSNKTIMNKLEGQRDEFMKKISTKNYRFALKQLRFHRLQFALIQEQPKLLWELKNFLPVFFWLVGHVNRRDGLTGPPVWAELDRLYRAGYLATVRHINHIARELGCKPETVSRTLHKLEEYGFLQIERNYTWGDQKSGWYHANLIILGYMEEEGEIWLYHTACKDWGKENAT